MRRKATWNHVHICFIDDFIFFDGLLDDYFDNTTI